MDQARRARAAKLEKDQADKARERQEAEAKSRSREALFNTPFAGATFLGPFVKSLGPWNGLWELTLGSVLRSTPIHE